MVAGSISCPACGTAMAGEPSYCQKCGAWLGGAVAVPLPRSYSRALSPRNLVILSLLTFGLYEYYWLYRNWTYLKAMGYIRFPLLRTLGLLVPILGIFLTYWQWRDFEAAAREADVPTYSSPGWMAYGWVFLSGLSARISGYQSQAGDTGTAMAWLVGGILIDLLGLLILVNVQRTLNGLWAKLQPDFVARTGFSGGQILILILGGCWWCMVLLGALAPS